jgi:hypothetical protein
MTSSSLCAQLVRVATWELDGFEADTPDQPVSEADVKRLRQIAFNLKPLDAEVVVLHGLPDRQFAKRLAAFFKPATYHVAHHSVFKKGFGSNAVVVGPPITVLSKKAPFLARSMEWKATGQIEFPAGFAFAGFPLATNSLCVYVAHLPADAAANTQVAADPYVLARKRELAAQYLAHHAAWLGSTLTNQAVSFFIAGDFLSDAKAARAEGAVRILQQAGFRSATPNLSRGQRSSASDEDADSPPMLTALLARNADFVTGPQVLSRKTFVRPIVLYDLNLAASVVPATAVAPNPQGPSGPVAARVVALDEGIIWLWVGGIAALSMTILFAVWLIRRAAVSSGMFGRRANNAVVLDMGACAGASNRYSCSRAEAESFSGSTTDAASQQTTLWRARAMQAEYRANRAAAVVRSGLMPQLGRLMRERLLAWLSSQRGQLLDSHEVGTQQVLELEQRLQRIQTQFQARMQTREERISELEQEILAKEKIIRDLLRAQVRLANQTTNQ